MKVRDEGHDVLVHDCCVEEQVNQLPSCTVVFVCLWHPSFERHLEEEVVPTKLPI